MTKILEYNDLNLMVTQGDTEVIMTKTGWKAHISSFELIASEVSKTGTGTYSRSLNVQGKPKD